MAVSAGLAVARLGGPQRFSLEHPQARRIGGVVVLHRLGFAAHQVVAGAAFSGRNFVPEGSRGSDNHKKNADKPPDGAEYPIRSHSTVMLACSVTEKPLSPVQVNVSVPLWVATGWNVINGLAAIAGNRSARKTSSPS